MKIHSFRPPSLVIRNIPGDERVPHRILTANLSGLPGHFAEFVSARTLLVTARIQRQANAAALVNSINLATRTKKISDVRNIINGSKEVKDGIMLYYNWEMMAMRSGAISLYNFGCSLNAINEHLKECKCVEQRTDLLRLRRACSVFSNRFKGWKDIRNAIAHQAEMTGSDERFESHRLHSAVNTASFKVPAGNIFLGNCSGDEFVTSWQGKVFSYRLDDESVEALKSSIEGIFKSFPDRGFIS